MYDVLIIGGGPAGITAAIYAARAGLDALTLEKKFVGGQAATTSELDNYPGFPNGITGIDFAMAVRGQADRLGARIRSEEVLSLELSGEVKKAVTKKGEYRARNVVLAMGASPRTLGLESEGRLTGRGVSYCATCDGAFHRGKSVAVVGGGDTAGEDALYLAKLCRKVYIVHRRDEFRMQKILAARIDSEPNIEKIMSANVTEILGDQFVSGAVVKTAGGDRTLDVSGVFVAVGITPDSALAPKELVNDAGFVTAGEDCKTAIPGVYAVGDLRTKPLRQVVTACADGAVAISMITAVV